MQIKIGSQKNRRDMGLREIESKHESIFCMEKSDIEVYLPRAWYTPYAQAWNLIGDSRYKPISLLMNQSPAV